MEIGKTIRIEKVKVSGIREKKQDIIPEEILLNIFINRGRISIISCSPSRIIELVTGYIISNGYTGNYGEIELVDLCRDADGDGEDDATSQSTSFSGIMSARVRISGYSRPGPSDGAIPYLSSGCGNIDPSAILAGIQGQIDPSPTPVDHRVILELGKKILREQKYKKEFGGLHSAALFNAGGETLSVMEDLGRHNCIDKIFGHMLINSIAPEDKIIFTSGRVSMDLVSKIFRMSVPVIVTNSSVTYNAAEAAQKTGLTLIGYARGKRFNIYSCPERII